MLVSLFALACSPTPSSAPAVSARRAQQPGAAFDAGLGRAEGPLEFVLQQPHAGPITAIASDRKATLIATVSTDSSIRLWSRWGRMVRILGGDGEELTAVALSDDASRVLAADKRGVHLWSTTGEHLARWAASPGEFGYSLEPASVTVAPDGTRFAVALNNVPILLAWKQGKLTRSPEFDRGVQDSWTAGYLERIHEIQFSADGEEMLIAGGDSLYGKAIVVWRRCVDGSIVRSIHLPGAPITRVSRTPDGRLLVGRKDGSLQWLAVDGTVLEVLREPTGGPYTIDTASKTHAITGIAFMPDVEGVLVTTGQGTVLSWTREEGLKTRFELPVPLVGLVAKSKTIILASASLIVGAGQDGEFIPPPESVYVTSVDASADGKRVLVASSDGWVRVWSRDFNLLHAFKATPHPLMAARFLPESDGLLILDAQSGPSQKARLMGEAGDHVREFEYVSSVWRHVNFRQGKGLDLFSGLSIVTYNLVNGKQYLWAENPNRSPSALATAAAGDDFAVGFVDGMVQYLLSGQAHRFQSAAAWKDAPPEPIVDLAINQPKGLVLALSQLGTLTAHDAGGRVPFVRATYSSTSVPGHAPEQGVMDTSAWTASRFPWEAPSGRWAIRNFWRPDRALAVSADGERIVTGSWDGTMRVWDAAGKLQRSFDTGAMLQSGGAVTSVTITPDGRHVLATTGGSGVIVADLATGATAGLVVQQGNWMLYTPDGYFDGSRGGGALLNAVQGLRAFSVDQIAAFSNRPDLVLEHIGLGQKDQLDFYRRSHELRLRKLGLEGGRRTTLEHAPSARIAAAQQTEDHAVLDVDFQDEGGRLARYQIYVNGVPLFQTGKPLSGASARVRERVDLSSGTNVVEVTALNEVGVESMREERRFSQKERPGDLYFIGFGVSRYRHPRDDLHFAHKDVLDLAEVLLGANGGAFRRVHVRTFVDSAATAEAVRSAQKIVAGAGIDDTVVVMAAGHGRHGGGANPTYFFLGQDTDPQRLEETAIPFDQIEGLLKVTRARKRLLFLDACRSGDPDAASLLEPAASGNKPGPRRYLLDRDRFVFADLARRSGAVVISSSLGSERAREVRIHKNGAFTQAILEALTSTKTDKDKDGLVSMEELQASVPARVEEITLHLQHPTFDRGDNRMARIALPLVPQAAWIAERPAPDGAAPARP
ncbi:caspase family protein [Sorangium sp. So ce429]